MTQGASTSEEDRENGAREGGALNADGLIGTCSSHCAVEDKNTGEAMPTVEDMIEAVHNGDTGKLQRLLAAGGQVNWVDDYGSTPLHCACFKCQPGCAEVLLQANALLHVTDMDGTPLHSACFHDSTACVQLLLAAKAAVNQTNSRDGETALHRACINGRDGIAKMLIDAGADASMLYRDKTPLQWAVERGKKSCQAVLQEEEKLAWARKLEAADRAAAALILEEEASSAAHGAAHTARSQRRAGKAKKKSRRRGASAEPASASASASGVSRMCRAAAEEADSEDEAYGSANGSSACGHSAVGNSNCSSFYSNSGSSSATGGRSGDASGAAACSPHGCAHSCAHACGLSGGQSGGQAYGQAYGQTYGQSGARPAEGHAARAPSLVDEALSAQRERAARHGDGDFNGDGDGDFNGDGDGDGSAQHARTHGSQHEWQLPRRRNTSAAATRSHGASAASTAATAHSAPAAQMSASFVSCGRTPFAATAAATAAAIAAAATTATTAATAVPSGAAPHAASSPSSSCMMASAASASSDGPFVTGTHCSQNERQRDCQLAAPPTAADRVLHSAPAGAIVSHSGSQHARSQCAGGADADRAPPVHGLGVEGVPREREGVPRESAARVDAGQQSEESRAAAKARHIEEHAREFEALQMEAASRSHGDCVDAGEIDIPSAFICPITQELMEDPVCTVDGTTYDRVAISQWLLRHDTSPLTGARLATDMLIPIHVRERVRNIDRSSGSAIAGASLGLVRNVLRSQIQEFRELHGLERRTPAQIGV